MQEMFKKIGRKIGGMKMGKVTIKLIGLIVVVVVGGLLFLKLGSGNRTEITGTLIGTKLEAAQELVSTKYYYTNAASFNNDKDLYGWTIPFTNKKFIVSYQGVIHVGLDFKEVKADVHGKEIILTLPAPKILSHEMNESSIKVFDEAASIFNPIKVEDFKQFTIDQEKTVEEEAVANGLLDTAKEDAKRAITQILQLSNEINKDYTITFK